MVLSEMRDNYWGAETIYRLFRQAEALLLSRNQTQRRRSQDATSTIDKDLVGGSAALETGIATVGVSEGVSSDETNPPDEACLGIDQFFPHHSGLDFLLDFDEPDMFAAFTAMDQSM